MRALVVEDSPDVAAHVAEALVAAGFVVDHAHDGEDVWFRGDTETYDVVILDPPREGAPDLMRQLVVTRPKAIVYVSCNPTAMARDLKAALSAGYQWSRLTVFDMFPQTQHTETLAVLYRPGMRP